MRHAVCESQAEGIEHTFAQPFQHLPQIRRNGAFGKRMLCDQRIVGFGVSSQ